MVVALNYQIILINSNITQWNFFDFNTLKKSLGKGTDRHTHRHTDRRTSRLPDRIGPVGRFGGNWGAVEPFFRGGRGGWGSAKMSNNLQFLDTE